MEPESQPVELCVVTPSRWVIDEISQTTAEVSVRHDLGMFAPPPVAAGTRRAWWMPLSYATRLRHCARALHAGPESGLVPTLSAPGPRPLTSLPTADDVEHFYGRRIECASVEQVLARETDYPDYPHKAWVKLGEAKTGSHFNEFGDDFAAGPRDIVELEEMVRTARVPGASMLQWTETICDFESEFRCFVLDREVVACAPYLTTDLHTGAMADAYNGAVASRVEIASARAFATDFLHALLPWRATDQSWVSPTPRGFVLDVGFDCLSDRWVVVEANPAWSAAWYGCDIDAVVATVLAANEPDPHWAWQPDAYYDSLLARYGPLR